MSSSSESESSDPDGGLKCEPASDTDALPGSWEI